MLFTGRRILRPPSAFLYTTLSFPTHLSLPLFPLHLLLLIIPLSFSFPISKKPSLSLSLSAITKNGLLAWLSVPVKCNPKSTASSPTTILMVMGSILYQGYHILLEMTVSKVGVDAMGTKTGGSFLPEWGCCLRVWERESDLCVKRRGGWWWGASALIVPLSSSLWSYDVMRWHCASIFCYFYFEKERARRRDEMLALKLDLIRLAKS